MGASPRRAREISSESGGGRRNCCCCCCCCGGGSEILSVAGRAPHLQPSPELPRRSLPAFRAAASSGTSEAVIIFFPLSRFFPKEIPEGREKDWGRGGKDTPPGRSRRKESVKKREKNSREERSSRSSWTTQRFQRRSTCEAPSLKSRLRKKRKEKETKRQSTSCSSSASITEEQHQRSVFGAFLQSVFLFSEGERGREPEASLLRCDWRREKEKKPRHEREMRAGIGNDALRACSHREAHRISLTRDFMI